MQVNSKAHQWVCTPVCHSRFHKLSWNALCVCARHSRRLFIDSLRLETYTNRNVRVCSNPVIPLFTSISSSIALVILFLSLHALVVYAVHTCVNPFNGKNKKVAFSLLKNRARTHKNQMLKWNDCFYLMIVSHTFGHRCCACYALQWNRSTTLIIKNETLVCTQNKCQSTSQAPLVRTTYHRYVLVRVPNLIRTLRRSAQAHACIYVHVHVNFT